METTTAIIPSEEQAQIISWFRDDDMRAGNLVVEARAGTGKTTTIKLAIKQAPEDRVLYAVFGKKNKLEAVPVFAEEGRRVDVKTLHGLGFAFIKYGPWGKDVEPKDEIEDDRISHVLRNVPEDVLGDKTFGAIKELVAWAKNVTIKMPTVTELLEMAVRDLDMSGDDDGLNLPQVAAWAREVLILSTEKDPGGRCSYNDMVWLPIVCGWVRPWYNLVVVDEAQDMNAPQLEMAIRACKKGGRICIVGDSRQAIFEFRGAVQGAIPMMQARLKAKLMGLTVTRRCPKAVVALAQTMVPDYQAAETAPEGTVTRTEGEFISKLAVGDAVLSRVNAPLMGYCLQVLKKGIPARIEGRDIGAQLAGLARKMRARSVPQFIEKITAWGAKQVKRLSKAKNAEQKIQGVSDQVDTLIELARDCKSVDEIVARVTALFEDSIDAQTGAVNKKPAVVFSSTHKAKGLEWANVFVLNDTFKCKGYTTAVNEEANLYYVAVTRAKATLTLVTEGKK